MPIQHAAVQLHYEYEDDIVASVDKKTSTAIMAYHNFFGGHGCPLCCLEEEFNPLLIRPVEPRLPTSSRCLGK